MKGKLMKYSPLLAAAALASIFSLSGCGLADTGAAQEEVDRFHQRWNANEFKAIHELSHPDLRSNYTAEELIASFEGVRNNYGAFQSAKQSSWSINTKNGVRVIELKYNSTFEKGPAVESFTYQMSGDKPLLVHYNIKTPEDAKKSEGEKKEGQ